MLVLNMVYLFLLLFHEYTVLNIINMLHAQEKLYLTSFGAVFPAELRPPQTHNHISKKAQFLGYQLVELPPA